jgi:type IV secretion system protein VirD4
MDPHDLHAESLYRLPNYTHSAAQGIALRGLLAACLDILVSEHLAASVLARRWAWPPHLGTPWIRFPAYPQPRLLAAAALATGALLLAAALAIPGRRAHHPHAPQQPPQRSPIRRRWVGHLIGALPLLLPALLALFLLAVLPVYPSLAFTRWSARYGAVPQLAAGVAHARFALFLTLAILLAVTLAATAARLAALRETGDTHGSSHWASPREVAATGLLDPVTTPRSSKRNPRLGSGRPAVVAGAWYGRAPGHLRRRLHALRDATDRHVLAFAPSGSGKSTALVVPTLLTWNASAVILDIKGELWHLTSGYRSQVLGQRCLRLDLASTDRSAAAYNPLLLVPRGPGDVKHAQSVADVLVDPEGRDQPRTFWEDSSHALLTAAILHVVHSATEPEGRSLAACDRLLSNPQRPLQETLEALLLTHHDPNLDLGWKDPHTGEATYTHPVVAAEARSLLDMDPRTSSNIVATAQAKLALFREPILAANTARSDFAPLDLVTGDRPLSLYLTIAPADLQRLRVPIRLFLNQLCRALTERLDFEAADDRQGHGGHPAHGGRPAHRHPLLLLLDEFPVLGKLDFFGRAMAYLRGYGIRVYLSLQSLSQLYDIYGQHQSITANCPLQIAFTPADLETAEHLSRLLGPTTVHLAKRSLNGAPLVFGPRRHTLSLQEHARPLLTAEEVRRLPAHEAIVLTAGHPPIRGRRAPYYADPDLAQRCRTPPPAASDRLAPST